MKTQNNAVSTRPGGITGKGFTPGQSGNPAGRPKGLAAAARAALGPDGHDVIEFFVSVMHGNKKALGERRPIVLRDRIEAAKLLAAYGYGKPAQQVDIAALQREYDEEQTTVMHEAASQLPDNIKAAIRAWLVERRQQWLAEQMAESEAKMQSYMPPHDSGDDSETGEDEAVRR